METDRGPSGSQPGGDTLPMVQQQHSAVGQTGTTSGQVSVSVGYPQCQHSTVLSLTLRQLSPSHTWSPCRPVRFVTSRVNERVIAVSVAVVKYNKRVANWGRDLNACFYTFLETDLLNLFSVCFR